MTNDTNTLNGALSQLGETLAENLTTQGVTASASDGLTTLTGKILDIQGGSGGGLEYETGIWTPDEDITRGEITFSKTHTESPAFIALADATGTPDDTLNTNYLFVYIDVYRMWGCGIPYDANGYRYAIIYGSYRASATTSISSSPIFCNFNSDSTQAGGSYAPRYWANSTSFRPAATNGTRYWRAGRTYKWIAIWKPTSNSITNSGSGTFTKGADI